MSNNAAKSTIRMQSIPANQSNISFNNQLNEGPNFNLFLWNFIYAGAGVATGDLNNDGLPDIYFAGNQIGDKVYINQGDFKFKDITSTSGINVQGWSTGVTMVDINNDGFLDIYVCKTSPTPIIANNTNRLYINQRNGTFKESAKSYGLDDSGFGIQASFLDADNDGDLDMYLVNQPFDAYAKLVNDATAVANYPSTDRLFINNGDKFTDSTTDVGIDNSRFGLNISLGDFNLDGRTDYYVCNDYSEGDHLYMNRNNQPKDELSTWLGHTSRFSMGSDVGDINQDGLLDIFTLDMAFQSQLRSKTNMETMRPEKFWNDVNTGHHYQYPQNNLQLNRGDGNFTEVAQVAGLNKSDWSWTPLLVDLDNDGLQDVAISNGILRDLKNNDLRDYLLKTYGGKITMENMQDVMGRIPSNPVPNQLFRNLGNLKFDNISESSGFDFSGFSSGMAYADFDGDGKMDVVVNNMNSVASIFKNVSTGSGSYLDVSLKGRGKNAMGIGSTVIAYQGDTKQVGCLQTTRGYMSASVPSLHFGFGQATTLDSLVVIWNEKEMSIRKNVPLNKKIELDYNKVNKRPLRIRQDKDLQLSPTQAPSFAHKETKFDDYKDQVLLPYKLSQNGPSLATGDVNGDGMEDLFIGGAAGQASSIFLGNAQGKYTSSAQAILASDSQYEDLDASLKDLNGDGHLDLVLSSGSNEFNERDPRMGVRAYLNNGKGIFQKSIGFPKVPINSQTHLLFDADADDDLDLLITGRLVSGQYPKPAAAQLWLQDNGQWSNASKERAPFLESLGMVTAAKASDLDGDGDQDVLLTGEWMAPSMMINGNNKDFSLQTIEAAGVGIWWTAELFDADGDGDQDVLLGNLGWNNKFGGAGKPKLEVYSDDFDKNGDHDVVLAVSSGGHTYPVRGRECSSEEMPFVLDKFPSYQSFGEAELSDLLSKEQMENSLHKKIKTFSSLLLINNGNLKFDVQQLPKEAQFGPIKSFDIADVNQDGHLDFVYGGNHFPTEVETARYDGMGMGICLGDGKGGFKNATLNFGGGSRAVDVRDLVIVKKPNGKQTILMAINDAAMQAYSIEL